MRSTAKKKETANTKIEQIAGLSVERGVPEGQRRPQTLLFVHGATQGSWAWRSFLPHFVKRGYECVAVNLPGHHLTPVPEKYNELGLEQYLEKLVEVAGELGTCIPIGHSMGGLLTLKLLEKAECPAGVALAPAPPGDFAREHFSEGALPGQEMATGDVDTDYLRWLGRQHFFPNVPHEEREELVGLLTDESEAATRALLSGAIDLDTEKQTSPVLLVAAEEDSLTPASLCESIARQNGFYYGCFRARAHNLMNEPGAEGIANTICDWFDDRLGALAEPAEEAEA